MSQNCRSSVSCAETKSQKWKQLIKMAAMSTVFIGLCPKNYIVEIKSEGEYFMTSIKGRNFRHNGRALRGHKVRT